MSEVLHPGDLAARIRALVQSGECVLFLGAGVSVRVGLPTWLQYMEHLAVVLEQHGDRTAGQLVRERAEDRDFLGAATIYKSSRRIPEGERWKKLAEPFAKLPAAVELEKLEPLFSLPFSAIVTTNYDGIPHEVVARVTSNSPDSSRPMWTPPVERNDGSMRSAALRRDFYIARIHGRADLPTTMIVDSADYDRLREDDEYLEFILELLRSRVCLFIGFSFVDPAINEILTLYKQRFGPVFRSLHAAVVPSDASDLQNRLHAVNIAVHQYDPANGHTDLWRALRLASENGSEEPERRQAGVAAAVALREVPNTHRLLAFAYAQGTARSSGAPIVNLVQDGLVASVLAERGEIISENELRSDVARLLRLSNDEVTELVEQSLKRLALSRHVARDNAGMLLHDFSGTNTLDQQLERLAGGVVNRMRVRDQVTVLERHRSLAKEIIESLFIARAWDVAAHYAGSTAGFGGDISRVIHATIEAATTNESLPDLGPFEAAVGDLFIAPEDFESALLAEIGRIAFGLQLVISTPRQALFHKHALPEIVYLDSNVLLPMIVPGHPLRPVYTDALRSLAVAAEAASVDIRIVVGKQFLNEVIAHRSIAVRLADELDLDNPQVLTQHLLFYGATNTNVFVGAFGSYVGRDEQPARFTEFLAKHAPYESEVALARYLRDEMRIESVEMHFEGETAEVYRNVYARLREAYPPGRKPGIVIEHEARQIAQLEVDQSSGRRSVFVTADNQLRRILQSSPALAANVNLTLSHVGLVAIVDVLVGIKTDSRSLTRLLWSNVYYGQDERNLYEYFVRLALRDYSEGFARDLQSLAKATAAVSVAEVKRDHVDLFGSAVDDVVKSAKLIDRVGNDFYKNWREVVDEKERGSS